MLLLLHSQNLTKIKTSTACSHATDIMEENVKVKKIRNEHDTKFDAINVQLQSNIDGATSQIVP